MVNSPVPLEWALQGLLSPVSPEARSAVRVARRLWRSQAFLTLGLQLETLKPPPAPPMPPGVAYIDAREVIFQRRLYAVEAFGLDRTPVTNAQWQRYVREAGAAPPPFWLGVRPPGDLLDHPVVGITMAQAEAYAAWRGARLPTTLEWTAAALGEWSGQRFPWGDRCDQTTCNCPLLAPRDTAPVDAHPSGASAEGVLDLFGNTWEWTRLDPRLSALPEGEVWVMGGSFDMPCQAGTGAPMWAYPRDQDALNVGFRCAVDL